MRALLLATALVLGGALVPFLTAATETGEARALQDEKFVRCTKLADCT